MDIEAVVNGAGISEYRRHEKTREIYDSIKECILSRCYSRAERYGDERPTEFENHINQQVYEEVWYLVFQKFHDESRKT